MTLLLNKYKGQGWFDNIESYCLTGSIATEERLIDSLRYVTMHRENHASFSSEFASILRDCCSIFGSTMHALLQGSGSITKSEFNIGDYRDFLRTEVKDIHRMTVQVFSLFPKGMIVPFEEFFHTEGVPLWWIAHNKLKHSEYEEYKQGNLENCTTALAALELLRFLMVGPYGSKLFVNVGIVYDDKSIDMSVERRLFP